MGYNEEQPKNRGAQPHVGEQGEAMLPAARNGAWASLCLPISRLLWSLQRVQPS